MRHLHHKEMNRNQSKFISSMGRSCSLIHLLTAIGRSDTNIGT
ncbi:hypothetical protein PVAP13_6NG140303 [Panicum virgatum]|uniref:Uncharacterized protein n=1 Tax=Panicum virgatum TaxID=38727 RepID=A0A8T0R157_PANVG|nr:hypothetical protein PVAP13_6NG140303 [Panicum virgatum]